MSLWSNVPAVKCPCGQMSLWSNVPVVKCPCGQMSLRSNVHGGQMSVVKCPWWSNVRGQTSLRSNVPTSPGGQLSVVKSPAVKCPCGQTSSNPLWLSNKFKLSPINNLCGFTSYQMTPNSWTFRRSRYVGQVFSFPLIESINFASASMKFLF